MLSKKAFDKKYHTGTIPKKSKDFSSTFFCRRACDNQTTRYSDEINWEDFPRNNEGELMLLLHRVETITKGAGKRRSVKNTKEDDDFRGGDPDDEEILRTPRKKQKTSGISTPKKIRTPSKLLTPSHKRHAFLFLLFVLALPVLLMYLNPEYMLDSPKLIIVK